MAGLDLYSRTKKQKETKRKPWFQREGSQTYQRISKWMYNEEKVGGEKEEQSLTGGPILEMDDQWCFWKHSSLWRLKEILKCLS